jgi:hypothetical protein
MLRPSHVQNHIPQQQCSTTMAPPTNSNESYCTFTLASDVTAGGLPSEDEIAKDLESNDDNVSYFSM